VVNGEPREAINVQFDYKVNAQGIIEQTQLDVNDRAEELVKQDSRRASPRIPGVILAAPQQARSAPCANTSAKNWPNWP
jgi:hypothetical protein